MTDQSFDRLIERCLDALRPWVEEEAVQSSPQGFVHLKSALGFAQEALRYMRSERSSSPAEERCLVEVVDALKRTLRNLRQK